MDAKTARNNVNLYGGINGRPQWDDSKKIGSKTDKRKMNTKAELIEKSSQLHLQKAISQFQPICGKPDSTIRLLTTYTRNNYHHSSHEP